ncbi:helix-turn-helix domain-containing protein [Allonocardiopsis opalescens]|uniref:Sugar diacid utilization regulator n=1 Tax=Allonocardiopsis opalescens TaxID=1144618 RepID=A0A2T0PYM5_9ACTN|nr:GAF domain-containing protein [Allonocardiopsis opalescens]PRX96646.1 sugar diacid utilization regulator [Allonocardiopsis opalescens]
MRATSAAALRRLLALLADNAPVERFGEPAALLRAAGADPAEVAEVEAATLEALRVHGALAQHRRREAQLTALFETSGDLAASRDLDTVLRAIVRRVRQLLGTDTAYLTLDDEERGDTYMRITDGSVSPVFQRLRLGYGEGLGGLVAKTAEPYASADYLSDPRFAHTAAIDRGVGEEGLVAILGVPLLLGERVIGVLFAADRAARAFTPDEVALLSSLAAHAAVAIDATKLLAETRAAHAGLRAKNAAVQRAEEAHDRLTDLVLRGADLTEVASAVGTVLAGGVTVTDAGGAVLVQVGTAPPAEAVRAVAESRTRRRAIGRAGAWVCAVMAGPEQLGGLVLTGRPDLGEADRRLFERAAVVTALLLMLRRSTAEAEDRLRGELVGELVASAGRDPAALAERARRLGLDPGRAHTLLLAWAPAAAHGRLAERARRLAADGGGISGTDRELALLLVPHAEPAQAARRASAELSKALRVPVTVAAGGPAEGLGRVPGAHAEARRCLDAMRALGLTGRGAAAADLGFAGMLLGDHADAGGYVRAVLGPLLDHDARRGTALRRTLESYYAHGRSLTRTAAALHVHVNTVSQRLDRVARLLGADWNSPDRELELRVALRVHALRG